MRCFVAIDLDAPVKQALDRWIASVRSPARDVRWCTPDQLHVTLKFLAAVPASAVAEHCRVVEAAASAVNPFEIRVGGLGAFPRPRRPHVLWCGIEDSAGGCAAWLGQAEAAFEQLGFAREMRPFHPHVTLARSRPPGGHALLRAALESAVPPAAIVMQVLRITLFESVPGRSGSRYTPLHVAPLGAANAQFAVDPHI